MNYYKAKTLITPPRSRKRNWVSTQRPFPVPPCPLPSPKEPLTLQQVLPSVPQNTIIEDCLFFFFFLDRTFRSILIYRFPFFSYKNDFEESEPYKLINWQSCPKPNFADCINANIITSWYESSYKEDIR